MYSIRRMVVSFGIISALAWQGLYAKKLKECENDTDRENGCVVYREDGLEMPYKHGQKMVLQGNIIQMGNFSLKYLMKMMNKMVSKGDTMKMVIFSLKSHLKMMRKMVM